MNAGAFGENFPYTNSHDLNLDWIIKTFRAVADGLEHFEETSTSAIETINQASATAQEELHDATRESINSVNRTAEEAEDVITGLITDFSVKHRIIFLADSYGGRVDSLGRTLMQLVKLNLISDDADYYSSYVPGAAFAHQTPAAKFITQLQNATISDPDTVTEIVVCCGANDANYTVTDTVTAISQFYQYAKNNYRRAKVIIVGAGLTFTPMGLYIKQKATRAFIDSTRVGVIYPAGCEYVMMDTYLLESDRVHPNAYGVPVLARAITEAITSGHCTTEHLKSFVDVTEPQYNATPIITLNNLTNPQLTLVDATMKDTRMSLIDGVFNLIMVNNNPLLSTRFNIVGQSFSSTENTIKVELTNTLLPGKIFVTGTVNGPIGMGYMVDKADPTNRCLCKILFSYDTDANKYYMEFIPIGTFTLTTNLLEIYGTLSCHM